MVQRHREAGLFHGGVWLPDHVLLSDQSATVNPIKRLVVLGPRHEDGFLVDGEIGILALALGVSSAYVPYRDASEGGLSQLLFEICVWFCDVDVSIAFLSLNQAIPYDLQVLVVKGCVHGQASPPSCRGEIFCVVQRPDVVLNSPESGYVLIERLVVGGSILLIEILAASTGFESDGSCYRGKVGFDSVPIHSRTALIFFSFFAARLKRADEAKHVDSNW
jgi:hypothetical protein